MRYSGSPWSFLMAIRLVARVRIAAQWRIKVNLVVIDAVATLKTFGVRVIDKLCVFSLVDVKDGTTEQVASGQTKHRLESTIDKNISAGFRVLDDDTNRDALDN